MISTRWRRFLHATTVVMLNVGIVVLLGIQFLHAYEAARARHANLDVRLGQYARIVQQIRAGELRVGRCGKMALPSTMAGATYDGCVYVGHIDVDTSHSIKAYLFPIFVSGQGKEVAGYVYVDGELSNAGDHMSVIFGDSVNSDAIDYVNFYSNAEMQERIWFRTGWFTQTYLPPLRKGPTYPEHMHWYFAQPFFDD